jgi:RNA polymerase sigma-70 factor (ECF subfamily)
MQTGGSKEAFSGPAFLRIGNWPRRIPNRRRANREIFNPYKQPVQKEGSILSWLPRVFQAPLRHEDRFTALVRPHISAMYRMAYRWTQNRDEAEDLVQDVLTRMIPRLEELAAVEKLKPWLIKVMYRRYVDLYRRSVNSPIDANIDWHSDDNLFEERIADTRHDIERLELQRALNQAMECLDDYQRDVIFLHDVEGHSALDVADILDISVGTVKSRLHRARKKLKTALEVGTFTASEAC